MVAIRRPIALDLDSLARPSLTSLTPFPVAPNLIAGRSHSVSRILIGLADIVLWVPSLEHICIPFLNGFSTVDWSSVSHKNRVLRVEGGDGGCVVIVDCLVISLNVCIKLLGYLWIGRVFLLGKARLIANTTRIMTEPVFIVSSGGLCSWLTDLPQDLLAALVKAESLRTGFPEAAFPSYSAFQWLHVALGPPAQNP